MEVSWAEYRTKPKTILSNVDAFNLQRKLSVFVWQKNQTLFQRGLNKTFKDKKKFTFLFSFRLPKLTFPIQTENKNFVTEQKEFSAHLTYNT